MRAAFALTLLVVFSAVAFASSGESDAEVDVEVEHPVLPGLGSGCFPKHSKRSNWRQSRRTPKYEGVCTTDAACPAALQEHGYCAGIGTVCCKNTAVDAPEVPKWVHADEVTANPFLKSTTSKCVAQRGTCGTKSQCDAKKGRTQSGLCPGDSTVICCFAPTAPTTPVVPPTTPVRPPTTPVVPPTTPAGSNLAALIRIPAGINSGLTMAGASFLIAKIGRPGCPLTAACFSCNCATNNAVISRNKVTMAVTPNVRITGLKPFVEAVKRAFDAMNAAGGVAREAYLAVKTAGGLCCRPIKRSNGTPGSSWSNHSWGVAADFYFGANMDPRGDAKTQAGLNVMAPYFAREKLYWAAGYGGASEDAMHFEASQQALNSWML